MSERKAVNLERTPDHRLGGPCPWCGETIRISVDVLYNQFTGSCPSCKNPVAYRAPDGTFRSDTADPAPNVWRIDRDHYCAICRHFIPECKCQPPTVMPAGVADSTPPPWKANQPRQDSSPA